MKLRYVQVEVLKAAIMDKLGATADLGIVLPIFMIVMTVTTTVAVGGLLTTARMR